MPYILIELASHLYMSLISHFCPPLPPPLLGCRQVTMLMSGVRMDPGHSRVSAATLAGPEQYACVLACRATCH